MTVILSYDIFLLDGKFKNLQIKKLNRKKPIRFSSIHSPDLASIA
jgi:hypothetical protein